MCGIFGQVNFNKNKNIHRLSEKAVALLTHRGPDEKGIWQGGGIFLGMRRLSIIDLTSGQQPIWNEDQTIAIIYNGELYNYLDLHPELESKGHSFRTKSDTEVVLHAYEEWGADCLKRFNGMFAFAIWDDKNRTLFLARDRVGEKPLYYFIDPDRLIFASEIKAILADPSVPRQVNLPGLVNYLAFGHAVAPDTIYQNIYKLLPGHYLLARNSAVSLQQYWDVGDEPQITPGRHYSEAEYANLILEILDDSVRRRMIADVPVGAFLSGGIDSSTVVSLMKKHATDSVKTFSLGFGGGGTYNELPDARRMAEYIGTEHYELQANYVDLIQILLKLVYHYDEPFGDAAGFPVFVISQFARQHVKVVLAGDGGDEIFGGYRRYMVDRLAPYYQFLPSKLINAWLPQFIQRLPRLRRIKRTLKTLPINDPARRYAAWLVCFTPDMQAELLNPAIFSAVADYDPLWPYKYYYPRLTAPAGPDHVNRLLYVDLKTWLPDTYMEKVDKATMACSLEARLPLLDHRLVELAFQIPGHYKIRGWDQKYIFKKAIAHLIPKTVLRKPKHGFAVPTDPWFRGDLKSFAFEVLLDERTRRRGYFNTSIVERLWREHAEGSQVWDDHLWLLLNFELWQRIFFDGDKF
ncbi:MAG: asparagine synthase (glutamine-hydrolyzing) [Desulfobacca sp.]|nr:asparagine synthase (glutamine-hydrolyzing) [Desulfobacca sp.]